MIRYSIQHYLYNKQQQKNELINLLKFLKLPVYLIMVFNIIELFRKVYFPNYEFFLSFMFWTVTILLILYWMPTKKEYGEWKKIHSTF